MIAPSIHTADAHDRIVTAMVESGPHYLIGFAREALNPLSVRIFGEADTIERLRELFAMWDEARDQVPS